jgi:3-hydroxyisobutyrate dehydrogenase
MRIAFVGLGIMGAPVAGHLVRAGHPVTIATRTNKPVVDELAAAGAQVADSPAAAALDADIVLTCLGTPAEVEQVYLGNGPGERSNSDNLAGAMANGSLAIDLTTSSPGLAEAIAARLAKRDVGFIDAPMTGGQGGAQKGTLTLLVGAHHADLERSRPLLSHFSSAIHHFGTPGSGSRAKIANQIAVASTLQGVAEALAFGAAGGLDPKALVESLTAGTADSFLMRIHGRKMVDGDMAPGFFIDHFVKDLRIALDEAAKLSLSLPGLTAAERCHAALADQGRGREGIQAVIDALLPGGIPPR